MSYDSDVINATSGRGEANWDLIIKLCNRIRDSVGPTSMSQAMGSVLRRVRHSDPNVQLHGLTLLEACVSNCGKSFQTELTSPSFQSEFKAILTGSSVDPRVTQRCKELLVSWANEYKSESSLSGLGRFVEQLHKDGVSFQSLQQPSSSSATQSQPTASVNEDEELRRAIQASLRDSNPTPASVSSTSSLYPSMPTQSSPTPTRSKVKKVRAIYDFEAAEDNELSFRAGEIVTVLDDSDENWWRGETQLGTGLFPASFVSTNLSVDPEPSQQEAKSKKKGKNSKSKGSKGKGQSGSKVNVDKIALLLDMIKEADVTSAENLAENETLVELEDECKKMRPVVEERMAALQKKEDEMQSINQKFEEALAMYRKLLAEGPRLGGSLPAQQQATPTPAAPVGPTTQQHPTSTQYSSPQQPSLQQPPSLQQFSSIPNPPPYFPPSSSATSLPSLSDSQSSLGPRPSMQLNGYQGNHLAGPPAAEQYANSLQMPPSLSLQSLQQQQQQVPPPALYTQPQVIGGAPPPPSMAALPPDYRNTSLYHPVHQPLL